LKDITTLNLQDLFISVGEILVPLCGVAYLAWFLGRHIARGKVDDLKMTVQEKKEELARYINAEKDRPFVPVTAKISRTSYPEPVSKKDPDDLKIIEGIGPRIEELLNKQGIYTFEQLADISPMRIAGFLKNAGPRFQVHDPASWPGQAVMAKEGKWEELQKLKDQLIAGRNP
jgi:predicted flap endonuclease-1-like 5' DNA nuclease